MIRHKLPIEDPKARSMQIAKDLGHDMINTTEVHNHIEGFLIINEGDYRGLTLPEIQSLTPYEEQ
jgi:hypothetical protein